MCHSKKLFHGLSSTTLARLLGGSRIVQVENEFHSHESPLFSGKETVKERERTRVGSEWHFNFKQPLLEAATVSGRLMVDTKRREENGKFKENRIITVITLLDIKATIMEFTRIPFQLEGQFTTLSMELISALIP